MRSLRFFQALILLVIIGTACQATPQGTATAVPTSISTQPFSPLPPTLVQNTPFANPPLTQAPNTPAITLTPTLAPDTYINPVMNHDFPDPEVLHVGDTYYAYSTNSAGINIQTASSTDLVHWKFLGDALPQLPSWAAKDFGYAWAPGVAKPEGNQDYVMYFAARYALGLGGVQCIGIATSPKPEGPFVSPAPEPFVCQRDQGGSIDGDVFVDEDGTQYFLWKSDNNSRGTASMIYIQPISEDGLTLTGQPTTMIKADQIWEGIVVEGPILWKQGGKYFLFYSANGFNTPKYAIGYAVADHILGPYQKAPGPFMKTDLKAGIVGPGGQDITTDADGQTWMLFHTWTPQAIRALGLARLEWVDGKPVLGELTRSPMPAPDTTP